LLEERVVVLHELPGGGVIHLPQGKHCGGCAGHPRGALQAVDAFSCGVAAKASGAGGEADQFGALQGEGRGFQGGEAAVVGGIGGGLIGAWWRQRLGRRGGRRCSRDPPSRAEPGWGLC
jgi:hypothetical protein